MQLSVWTERLRLKRELWHLGDWVPGFPIPVVQAMAAGLVFFAEWFIARKLHLELALPGPMNLALILALPGAAWYLAGRPAIQGKTVQDYFIGQIRFWLLEPRTLVGEFERVREPARLRWSETAFEEVTQ